MQPLRTAILGCGDFAHQHAASLISQAADIELAAFCDRNEEKARAYADQYRQGQARVYTDYQQLLQKEPLDLLVICLPPYGHKDEVEMAAQRGIHIFMEKPIALSSDHAWQMVAACEQAGIKTQVGFLFRFGEAIEQFKNLVDSGEAGPVGLMAARYFCNSLHTSWWRNRQKSGGQFLEQVTHMVDLMRFLLGDPVSVYSKQENLFHKDMPDYTIEDVSATIFGFPSGAMSVVYASNGAIRDRWIHDFRVVAQRVTAEFTHANNATFYFNNSPEQQVKVVSSERNLHLYEMLDLIHAIRGGGKTRTPLREGAKALDLALAAYQSAQTGMEVRLSTKKYP